LHRFDALVGLKVSMTRQTPKRSTVADYFGDKQTFGMGTNDAAHWYNPTLQHPIRDMEVANASHCNVALNGYHLQ
jgi:hypothetical protein